MKKQQSVNMNNGFIWIVVGSLLAGVGVILGSIGAHGLEDMLDPEWDDIPKRLANWDTGVRYQMYHSFGLITIGVLTAISGRSRIFTGAALLMLAGILFFSGCLYGWCLLDIKWMVMIVPAGGLSFILAWLALPLAVYRANVKTTTDAGVAHDNQ